MDFNATPLLYTTKSRSWALVLALFCLHLFSPTGLQAANNHLARWSGQTSKNQTPKTLGEPKLAEKALNEAAKGNLLFVENKGQVIDQKGKSHPEILFTATSNGAKIYVTNNSIHYVFSKITYKDQGSTSAKFEHHDPLEREVANVSTHRMTVSLVGANPHASLETNTSNPYFENYYLAHCPSGITAYSYERLTIKGVYSGVDWVIYSNGHGLKYDFVLSRANLANQIKLNVAGAESQITNKGELKLNTSLGSVTEEAPVSFQKGRMLKTNFKQTSPNTFGFEVNGAEPNQSLTIDPSVIWSTYYGGGGDDRGASCAVDKHDNVFVTGLTNSTDFPILNGFQSTHGTGSVAFNAFVVKIDSSGQRAWASYFGGSVREVGRSVAIDSLGNVLVVGNTNSSDMPIAFASQTSLRGNMDAFLAKFTNSGTRLWSTFFGGSQEDEVGSCAIDSAGNIYLIGRTISTNLQFGSVSQPNYGGNGDAYIAKFTGNGNRIWTTYLGGNDNDQAMSCGTDKIGNLYVAGVTSSANFPVSAGAIQTTIGGAGYDAFAAKFNTNGQRLWSTYYGGSGYEIGNTCAVTPSGDFCLVGYTDSRNLAVQKAWQPIYAGGTLDAFIVRFDPNGNRKWATFYGGTDRDFGFGCAIDKSENLTIIGFTVSTDLPIDSSFQPGGNAGGSLDGYLAKFDPDGNQFWGSYYGGSEEDNMVQCTMNDKNQLYVTGSTSSTNFRTLNGFRNSNGGGNYDAIIYKLDSSNCSTPIIQTIGSTTICSGASVTMVAHGGKGLKYQWNTGDSTRSITVTRAGNYSVRSIGRTCTSSYSLSKRVDTIPSPSTPTIAASGATTFCAGGAVTLTAPAGLRYRWSNNDTTRSILVTSTGSYNVRTINTNGCPSDTSAPTVITVNPLPSMPSITRLADTLSIIALPGTIITWLLNGNPIPGGATRLTISQTGNYTVRVATPEGCADTSAVLSVLTNLKANLGQHLAIYPNPTTGIVKIDWGQSQPIELQISNTLGQLVQSITLPPNTNELNVSNLAKGVYMVQAPGFGVTKLVKE